MQLLREHHPEDPALDMALSAALLHAVARGEHPPAVRVFRPGACVAFGRLDVLRPGFARAAEAARRHGRAPVVRLAGGHAAGYDRDCLILELVRPVDRIVGGHEGRYAEAAALLREAVATAGVSLELGELAGEYCPGRFSLHLPGGPKVAGIAQRVIRGAALTSAVLVASGGDRLRAVISEVYGALEIPVRIEVAGALSDGDPAITAPGVERAVLERVRAVLGAEPAGFPAAVQQAVTEHSVEAEAVAAGARGSLGGGVQPPAVRSDR